MVSDSRWSSESRIPSLIASDIRSAGEAPFRKTPTRNWRASVLSLAYNQRWAQGLLSLSDTGAATTYTASTCRLSSQDPKISSSRLSLTPLACAHLEGTLSYLSASETVPSYRTIS